MAEKETKDKKTGKAAAAKEKKGGTARAKKTPAKAQTAPKAAKKTGAAKRAAGKSAPSKKAGAKPVAKKAKPAAEETVPRLKNVYHERLVPELIKKFGYRNKMLVPALNKVVLNVGIGTLHQDPKLAESVVDEMRLIAGQAPVLTRARRSISNFKLRQGMVVGCRVTLRRDRMYEFLDRLISVVIPRIRDFRGLSDRSFDGRGNYTFGVREQIIFPEIDYDKVVKIHGMDITISTSARNDEEALELLRGFGFPFRRHTVEDREAA